MFVMKCHWKHFARPLWQLLADMSVEPIATSGMINQMVISVYELFARCMWAAVMVLRVGMGLVGEGYGKI
jgi:hypothetical protein